MIRLILDCIRTYQSYFICIDCMFDLIQHHIAFDIDLILMYGLYLFTLCLIDKLEAESNLKSFYLFFMLN